MIGDVLHKMCCMPHHSVAEEQVPLTGEVFMLSGGASIGAIVLSLVVGNYNIESRHQVCPAGKTNVMRHEITWHSHMSN